MLYIFFFYLMNFPYFVKYNLALLQEGKMISTSMLRIKFADFSYLYNTEEIRSLAIIDK